MPDNRITSQHLPRRDSRAILIETAWKQAGCLRLGTTTTIDRCGLSTSGSEALCILAVLAQLKIAEGVARARLLPRIRLPAVSRTAKKSPESTYLVIADGELPKFCIATQGGRRRRELRAD